MTPLEVKATGKGVRVKAPQAGKPRAHLQTARAPQVPHTRALGPAEGGTPKTRRPLGRPSMPLCNLNYCSGGEKMTSHQKVV